jgi:hypothetical protein
MGRDQALSFSLAAPADLARAKPPRSSKGWLCRFRAAHRHSVPGGYRDAAQEQRTLFAKGALLLQRRN